MNLSKEIKKSIVSYLKEISTKNDNIVSTTIVGSFLNSNKIEAISDIDIVLIVKELNEDTFDEIINSYQNIKCTSIGLEGFDVFVNSTFGPLKFNSNKKIVFHVMIYDIDGHIDHVEQSPFTCHSWENFKPIQGLSLKEVYPVLNLQLDDIIQTRRGIKSYLDDIEKGSISFRAYKFFEKAPRIVKDNFELDSKHRIEYSYHITYHLLNNFYKIITRESESLKDEKLIEFSLRYKLFPVENISFFKDLFLWKKRGGNPPLKLIENTRKFILDFFSCIDEMKKSLYIISFKRHQKTDLNDGTFLGSKRNPSIIKISNNLSDFKYQIGYHSELKRSRETIVNFNIDELKESPLLNEINYGLAEGLNIKQLNEKFPNIILEWKKGNDPNFPNGESQKDVLTRVKFFLSDILNYNINSLIITHLVVLRMILFYLLELNFSSVYKIKIDYLEGFDLLSNKRYLSIQFNKEIRSKIRKQLSIIYD